MKRTGNLWEKFITKENFQLAWRLTRKHRGRRHDIQEFESDLEVNLEKLRQKVASGNFHTSPYKNKYVNENTKKD